MSKLVSLETIAKMVHAAINTLNEALGEPVTEVTDDILASSVKGVQKVLDNPDITPKELHNNWVEERKKAGWIYGKVKDQEKKTHPDLVPYEELPAIEKVKDLIFLSIVKAFAVK